MKGKSLCFVISSSVLIIIITIFQKLLYQIILEVRKVSIRIVFQPTHKSFRETGAFYCYYYYYYYYYY